MICKPYVIKFTANFKVTISHRCIAVNFGGCERFLSEFPQTCPNNFAGKLFVSISSFLGWPSKKVFMWFFPRCPPILSIYSSSLPRTLGICKHLTEFCPDFHGFFPGFRQIKTFGCAHSTSATPPPTPLPSLFFSFRKSFLDCFWLHCFYRNTFMSKFHKIMFQHIQCSQVRKRCRNASVVGVSSLVNQ